MFGPKLPRLTSPNFANPEVAVPSAGTVDLGQLSSNNVAISGTTTITSFGSSASLLNPYFFIRFTGAMLLTYNATSMIMPSSANITTVAGDVAVAQYMGGSNWIISDYLRLSGKALIAPAESEVTFTDITTNDSSTTKHGYLKKLDNTVTNFMNGTGAWSVPSGTAAGLTTIASGNCATGSPTVIDMTSIAATYRSLLLYVSGASNSVATRALTVTIDTGLGLGNAENGHTYKQIDTTTVGNTAGALALWNAATETAAQTSSCLIEIPTYQSGPAKRYNGVYAKVTTAGSEWASGVQTTNGILTGSSGAVARTGAVVGVRLTWDNVATGVFDAGTYALYGLT